MMRVVIVFILCLWFINNATSQTKTKRPGIGVTLSGGGAKGLAHIGILKAMDSAGLKISYVTGTSMGSIVGALYAGGYSADSIEKMVRAIDWDLLLSNSSDFRSLIMDEKSEYGRYAVELPFVNNKFQLPSGLLESEELWLKFGEVFFPLYKIKDFTKLSKPFKCIATDVSSGEIVVLDSGELTYAIRASMAIPSAFTAVEYKDKKLVDGGLVRNFPVTDLKSLGADYIIGSSVSGGLLPKEKINNVIDVMLQIVFFREDADSKNEKKLCNIYINQTLNGYSTGSFSSSDAIIDSGIERGYSLYPTFKALADSLNGIYGKQTYSTDSLPKIDSVFISQYEVKGLYRTTEAFFLHRMQFDNNRWYKPNQISAHIRKAFGSRYYNRIIYTLEPLPDGTAKIIFNVDENPLTFAKLGINYNSFAGVSLLGNLTTRNFFTPYSRSLVTLNFGENMRLRGEHLQYIGRYKTVSVTSKIQVENLAFNTYNNFIKEGVYKQGYFVGDLAIKFSLHRKNSFGLGARFESLHYKPDIASQIDVRGHDDMFTGYFSYKLNTLSNIIYPKKGTKIDVEAGYIFNQCPNIQFYRNALPASGYQDSLHLTFNNFTQIKFQMENYIPLLKRYTIQTKVQAGMNFNDHDDLVNNFLVGGMNNLFRNQITFAGVAEGTIRTSSTIALELGLRYQMFTNLYITGRASSLTYDFIAASRRQTKTSFLTGYTATLGYNFFLGPLEISAMYCDQSKAILPYFSLGISF